MCYKSIIYFRFVSNLFQKESLFYFLPAFNAGRCHFVQRVSTFCFVVIVVVVETLVQILLYAQILFNFTMLLQSYAASIFQLALGLHCRF
jgi:hypothetical protein